MDCTIEWNRLSLADWEARFARIPVSNVLQCYDYARAVCPIEHLSARWGLIKIDGVEAGLVQIMEAGVLRKMLHAVVLDRGPLWFEGFGKKAHIEAFFKAFNQEFPRRFGRRRRIIAETEERLDEKLYEWQDGTSYETVWIDLTLEEETLRANLNGKWRGWLNKAQRSDLEVVFDDKGVALDWLIGNHVGHRMVKGYKGVSPKTLLALRDHFAPRGDMFLAIAQHEGQPVAGVMVLCHGSGATYQLGYNGKIGREKGAHHVLLWQCMMRLKQQGFKGFDLGGVNEEEARDVKTFKMAMGGRLLRCSGCYH